MFLAVNALREYFEYLKKTDEVQLVPISITQLFRGGNGLQYRTGPFFCVRMHACAVLFLFQYRSS